MAVTSMHVRSVGEGSLTLTTRRQAAGPRLVHILIGGMLELMIHAIETLRDRRTGTARG